RERALTAAFPNTIRVAYSSRYAKKLDNGLALWNLRSRRCNRTPHRRLRVDIEVSNGRDTHQERSEGEPHGPAPGVFAAREAWPVPREGAFARGLDGGDDRRA